MPTKIKVEFTTRNAAFEDNPEREIVKIFAQAGVKSFTLYSAVASGEYSSAVHTLTDSNGNTIGQVGVFKE